MNLVIERSKFDHTESAGDQAALQQEKIPFNTGVSIWRSYFIANEWNEIQTYRKTSLTFNLIIVLLFMEVIGFSNITRFDPFVIYNLSPDAYRAPYYRMFRFAVIVSIFGITGIFYGICGLYLFLVLFSREGMDPGSVLFWGRLAITFYNFIFVHSL